MIIVAIRGAILPTGHHLYIQVMEYGHGMISINTAIDTTTRKNNRGKGNVNAERQGLPARSGQPATSF
jgi:hypothetical protein